MANDYADPTNPVFDGRLEHELHARPGRDGRIYPVHDVGFPILAAPYFTIASAVAEQAAARLPPRLLARARLNRWILLRQLLSLGMIGVACFLASLFFDACLQAGGCPRAAFLWAMLWIVSPPLVAHTFTFFTEVPTAFIALWLFVEARRPVPPGPARAALLGLSAGWLALIHARNAPLTLALAVLLFVRFGRGAMAARAALSCGVALALGLRTYLTWRMWGTLVTTPHASFAPASPAEVLVEMPSRLLAWFLDAEHGLLPWAPVYLMLPAGLALLRRSAPAVLRDAAWIALPCMLAIMTPMINRHGWRGGWSPAARFLVPIAPFLALAVLHALMHCRSWLRVVLVAAQCALDGLYWARPRLLWEDGDGRSGVLEAVAGTLRLPAAWWPSWTWPPGALMIGGVVALALWAALTLVLLRSAAPCPVPDSMT